MAPGRLCDFDSNNSKINQRPVEMQLMEALTVVYAEFGLTVPESFASRVTKIADMIAVETLEDLAALPGCFFVDNNLIALRGLLEKSSVREARNFFIFFFVSSDALPPLKSTCNGQSPGVRHWWRVGSTHGRSVLGLWRQ